LASLESTISGEKLTKTEKPPKAAMEMVCMPKEERWFGVIDLKSHNEALMMKNLHKFFNRVSIIWKKLYPNGRLLNHVKNGSFWLRDILKFLDIFKGFTVVQIVDRKRCLLWDDLCHSQVLRLELLELHSFAKKFISVKMVVSRNSALQLFHLPISKSDFAQF